MSQNNIEISAAEAAEKIKNGENVVFLDVRNKNEFDEGHIKNAILIPLDRLSKEQLEQNGIKQNDGREIIVYCKIGARSQAASEMMIEWGYKIRHLTGGIEGWTPLET